MENAFAEDAHAMLVAVYISFRPPLASFVKEGIKPHESASRRRLPVSGCRRTTIAVCVGATFQLGGWFGMDPSVRKISRIRSGERVKAKRPHMAPTGLNDADRPVAQRTSGSTTLAS